MKDFLKSRNGIIALVVIAILIAGILAWRSNKKSEPGANSASDEDGQGASFPLKVGSEGKEVEQLQMHLLREYGARFPKHGVDGAFGPETLAAVKKWLKKDTVSRSYFDKVSMGNIPTVKFT